MKQILAKPIQLTDQVMKAADEASSSKQECAELKTKTEKLAGLLRQAARSSSDLYQRPTCRIIDDTQQVLDKALALVLRCRDNGIMRRVFTITPAAAFRKMSSQLENSIGDVSWLLRVSAPERGDEYHGLPPIAANEPILALIWEQIAVLIAGSLEGRSDAAASLVSLAQDNYRNGKLIIEEGGVGPLLKLVKEGQVEGQENAARAIGLLGRDTESVQYMMHKHNVASVFAKILKEAPMKVQAMVAWAVSELVTNYPSCQDLFAQHNVIRLLVTHLAFETIEEHSKYTITSKTTPTSIQAVVDEMANSSTSTSTSTTAKSSSKVVDADNKGPLISHPTGNKNPSTMHQVITKTMALNSPQMKPLVNDDQSHTTALSNNSQSQMKPPQNNGRSNTANGNGNANANAKAKRNHHHHHQSSSLSGSNTRARELEDPVTKAKLKAMAARALWSLAKGSTAICRSITESRALLCFAALLEKGPEDVKLNSAMALMEIAAVAEKDTDLRRSAFKPNSPACKALVDQVLNIIGEGESDLLIPCIKTIGSIARTFRATETRIIRPLVQLLDEREAEVSREASIALTKFATSENYLHNDHSKAIISAGGAKHLVQLVYFGEQMVKVPALILLCYCAFHVPDSEELAHAEVLAVLEWASKQAFKVQDDTWENLLHEAKSRLELYQSRGTRRFYEVRSI